MLAVVRGLGAQHAWHACHHKGCRSAGMKQAHQPHLLPHICSCSHKLYINPHSFTPGCNHVFCL